MEWVANKLVPQLRAHPEMNDQNVYDFMIYIYRVKVSNATLYRAIKEAHKICEENRDNWTWFLRNLVDDLEDPELNGYSFIYDRQKGLDAAPVAVCLGAPHRYCARHVWANLSNNWNGKALRDGF
ncbi:hypothetical protein CRG98_031235 [Punica granatum]|uniref:MULE transposase domain-containing protein n=1 Tax=Punica granatum TaxID=22663 RepID=A0A2I0IWJ0_PUNGR|nr:hypothetical protein CRG98_031235 [Punica granatum]